MLEDVLQVGPARLLQHQVHTLQLREIRVELPVSLRHGGKQLVQETPADDGGHLQRVAHVVAQPIDARQQDALQGVGDLNVGDFLRCAPALVLVDNSALLDQAADHFLAIRN